jgi:predicted nucleotidyltransferase
LLRERVSLFGSFARGRRDLFTDLDVLVVWETERPLLERLRHLHALLDVAVDLDVLCYTPSEFARMKARPFLRRAIAEEVLLFESKLA